MELELAKVFSIARQNGYNAVNFVGITFSIDEFDAMTHYKPEVRFTLDPHTMLVSRLTSTEAHPVFRFIRRG